MNKTRDRLTSAWTHVQKSLFPFLQEEIGELSHMHAKLVAVLDLVGLEAFSISPPTHRGRGRPRADRRAIARAFVALTLFNLPSRAALLERLSVDQKLRRICGWESKRQVPSEATFSRAFAEFAKTGLPAQIHEALIRCTYKDQLVGHISRDSTEIVAREKPQKRPPKPDRPKRKRGRPKKGEAPSKEPRRLERQAHMSLEQMLDDLPKVCDVGTKRNSKGHTESWIGYKFHLDVADGQVPISALLTSASLHDSQAAIPLATMTKQRVESLYDLMDAAYDAAELHRHSQDLGHVPIIDTNPRSNAALKEELAAECRRLDLINFELPEKRRYNVRTTAERAYARLKDELGVRMIRVRGHTKIFCQLMFAVLALSADQLIRLGQPIPDPP